jgi:hypothetical protein
VASEGMRRFGAGESLVFWYIESLRADVVLGVVIYSNIAPHAAYTVYYTWDHKCEFSH